MLHCPQYVTAFIWWVINSYNGRRYGFQWQTINVYLFFVLNNTSGSNKVRYSMRSLKVFASLRCGRVSGQGVVLLLSGPSKGPSVSAVVAAAPSWVTLSISISCYSADYLGSYCLRLVNLTVKRVGFQQNESIEVKIFILLVEWAMFVMSGQCKSLLYMNGQMKLQILVVFINFNMSALKTWPSYM